MSLNMRSAPSQEHADMVVDRSGENAVVMNVVNAFGVAVRKSGTGGARSRKWRLCSGFSKRFGIARETIAVLKNRMSGQGQTKFLVQLARSVWIVD